MKILKIQIPKVKLKYGGHSPPFRFPNKEVAVVVSQVEILPRPKYEVHTRNYNPFVPQKLSTNIVFNK